MKGVLMSFSVSALVQAARLPPLRCTPLAAKMVLLALAARAADDGGRAWPSQQTIGDEVGLSQRHVRRVLGCLVAAGLVGVEAKAAQHKATVYRLNLAAIAGLGGDTVSPLDPSRPDTMSALDPSRPDTVSPLGKSDTVSERTPCPPILSVRTRTKDPEGARPQGPDRTKEQERGLVAALEVLPARIADALEGRKSPRPGGAPIHASHRGHAQCGRVCLPAVLFDEFKRRRNHLDADREVRDWALEVEKDWEHFDGELGTPWEFWRARYSERWPTTAAASASHGLTRSTAITLNAIAEIRAEEARKRGNK